MVDRHVGEAGIGNVALTQFESEARRLDLKVIPLHAVRRVGGEIEALQDIEHHERRDALAGRRDFQKFVPEKIGGDRLYVVGFSFREVIHRQQAAEALQRGDQVLRDFAGVEHVPAPVRRSA